MKKILGCLLVMGLLITGSISFAKSRKPNQTGDIGKEMDPKSAAMFKCLRDLESNIENLPILTEYRKNLFKSKQSGNKDEAQKADAAFIQLEGSITDIRLNACENVIGERFR